MLYTCGLYWFARAFTSGISLAKRQAMTSVAPLVGRHSAKQEVTGLIPVRARAWAAASVPEATDQYFSLAWMFLSHSQNNVFFFKFLSFKTPCFHPPSLRNRTFPALRPFSPVTMRFYNCTHRRSPSCFPQLTSSSRQTSQVPAETASAGAGQEGLPHTALALNPDGELCRVLPTYSEPSVCR